MDQNLVLAYIPLRALPQVYGALDQVGLAEGGAHEIEDVTTCPGAYSCNLALTKSMNLGAALAEVVKDYSDPLVRKLSIKISGCPNSCGQHWIGDIGFYGNARKIDGKEVPYYLMLLGGGYDAGGVMRFGVAIQSIPARLAPEAVRRVLNHYMANRQDGESFRDYVLRHKVETFRGMTNDLVKPPELSSRDVPGLGRRDGVFAATWPRRVRQLAGLAHTAAVCTGSHLRVVVKILGSFRRPRALRLGGFDERAVGQSKGRDRDGAIHQIGHGVNGQPLGFLDEGQARRLRSRNRH